MYALMNVRYIYVMLSGCCGAGAGGVEKVAQQICLSSLIGICLL